MTGAEMIAAERRRQVEAEGYDARHDAGVGSENLTDAAITYALASEAPGNAEAIQDAMHDFWPWQLSAWKPTGDRVRDLVKAGALIAAAIDVELASRGGAA